MTDSNKFMTPEERKARSRVCRVAYTINNSQPVRSTIIGDQPFFYADEIDDFMESDDGLFFGAGDTEELGSEIERLKKEIESFERLNAEYAQEPDRSYQDFLEDKAFVAKSFEATAKEDPAILVNTLEKSRIAKAYLECAEQHGVRIQYSHQVEDAVYERKTGLILINPVCTFADKIMLAARELRRHWQHRQGALLNPLLFHPDNAVLINRLQSADLLASMIRTAWELQLCGERGAWERIENSSLSDMGHAFAREAFADFRTINNGQASAAVVESWFLSERCRHEDKRLIKQMLADYKGYVFDKDDIRQAITPSLISALGTMPYGKNYLAQHSNTILQDPVFTEVRDRSNANFLWFIKFERSFRETERDLQASGDLPASDIRSSGKTPPKETVYENAEIIQLFAEAPAEKHNSGDKSENSGRIMSPKPPVKRTKNKGARNAGTNVVYLRRWSGK